MQTEIASYPAYKIFKREPNELGYTEITIDDKLALYVKTRFGDHYETFTPGSVTSYALSYNECPIKAVEKAIARGHELHWLNNNGSCLSSDKREQEKCILIEIGMKIYFQGKTFEIVATPNHNLNLKVI